LAAFHILANHYLACYLGVRHLGMNRAIFLLSSLMLMSCTGIYKAATGTYKFYKVTDDRVDYYSWNPMSERYYIKELKGVDSSSFKQISVEYGKDIDSVFHHSIKIEFADPESFKLINEYYAIDRSNAYFIGRIIAGSDPKTFKYNGNSWSRDKNNYFYQQNNVNVCDMPSFKFAADKFASRASDKDCYFVEGEKVSVNDIASLEVLPGNYAKDKFTVYWGKVILENADPKAFKVKSIGSFSIAKDVNHCYSATQILSCSDLNPEGQKFCGCSE
jgi:hypothetical protein